MFFKLVSRSVSYFTNSVPFLMLVCSSGRSYEKEKGKEGGNETLAHYAQFQPVYIST